MESGLVEPNSKAEATEGEKRHHLESIVVNKKSFAYADKTLYRVYDAEDHFKLVEAESAAEAFQKSGLGKAYKIQREAFFHYVALDKDAVSDSDEVIEVSVEMPTEAEKALFLDAALIDDAVEKSKRIFEEVAFGGLYPKEQAESVVQSEPMPESDVSSADEGQVGAPEQSAAEVAAEPEAVQPEPEVVVAPEEDETPDEALSSSEINTLLAAQED